MMFWRKLIYTFERVLVVVGFLVLTDTLYPILPPSIYSLIQYSTYLITFLFLGIYWQQTIKTILRDIFLLLLLGWTVLSYLWSDLPDFTSNSSMWVIFVALFSLYFASRFKIKEQLQLLAITFGIIVVLNFLYTLAFPGIGIHADAHAGAWRGVYTHKNSFGRITSLASVIFLIFALNFKQKNSRQWLGFGLAILLLLLSTSKTALGVFLIATCLLPFYYALRWADLSKMLLYIVSILLGGGLLILIIGNAETIADSIGRDLTLTGRTDVWGASILKIMEHPWLGYGRGVFWHPSTDYAAEVGSAVSPGYVPPHAHNGFINLALDLGLTGVILFFLSFIFAYGRAIKWAILYADKKVFWYIMYLSFFLLYNITESTIMMHNSAEWALYMSTSFSLSRLKVIRKVKRKV